MNIPLVIHLARHFRLRRPSIQSLLSLVTLGSLFLIGPVGSAQTSPQQLLLTTVKNTMAAHFLPDAQRVSAIQQLRAQAQKTANLPAALQKAGGVFVTLSKNGKPRACWGSLAPTGANRLEETLNSTLGALTREYRYPPIHANEWAGLKKQVTLVRGLTPVSSPHGINPFKDGVMVRSNGKSGIILPGEALDAHHQVVMAKLKAGIQPKEPFQLYRIQADVYR